LREIFKIKKFQEQQCTAKLRWIFGKKMEKATEVSPIRRFNGAQQKGTLVFMENAQARVRKKAFQPDWTLPGR